MAKPKLVLLPGLDGTGELFTEFVRALPHSIETEIFRYPREKKLSYPQLLSMLRDSSIESEEFVLVAESFSSPLAIQYAAGNPSNLLAVVLCGGFAMSPIAGWKGRAVLAFAPVLFRLPLSNGAARFFLIGRSDSGLIAKVRSAIFSVRPTVLVDRLRSVLECDVRAEVEKIAVPLLYLQGSQDRLVGSHCVEEIKRKNPSLQIQVIDGPHLLLQAKAHQTAKVINRFIETLKR